MNRVAEQHSVTLYPLTHPQQRIWLVEKIYPGTTMHHISGISLVKAELDWKTLEASIHHFIACHDAARFRFVERDQEVWQYIHEFEPFTIKQVDFSQSHSPQQAFEDWYADRSSSFAFDLCNRPLFDFTFVRLDELQTGFFFTFHHLIADGWSLGMMVNRIWEQVAFLSRGQILTAPPQTTYLDYMDSESNYLSSTRFQKNKSFWHEKFHDLPSSYRTGDSAGTSGKRRTFNLNAQTSKAIKTLVDDIGCSLNTFFVSIMLIYLSRAEQKQDIVIGTPVLNRSGRKEKQTFGMFTSTMPFRFKLNDDLSFERLLLEVNGNLKECYFHQKYPYDQLVRDLDRRKEGNDDLVDICVNYYNTRLVTEIDGCPVVTTELYSGHQLYALQLVVKEWSVDEGLMIHLDYKTGVYAEAEIERIWERLHDLARLLVENPLRRVGDASMVTDEERERLIHYWNDTAADYPAGNLIHQLFEEQVFQSPDRIAIHDEHERLTYSDLNRKANQLARQLQKKGAVRGSIIAIMAKHSVEVVAAILAVHKTGGAYVPIDPDYPADRIRYLLEDSGASLLLTNGTALVDTEFNGLVLNLYGERVEELDDANLDIDHDPADLAYIIYTSGSTGKPKGVMIEHQGLMNYIWWAKKQYVRSNTQTFALYSSLSFDLTVTSLFTPLINGNPIVIYRDDRNEFVLHRIVSENRTNILKLTPSHLSLLKDMDLRGSSIQCFIVGGEDLKTSLASRIHECFGGEIDIYNEYGPTETVVGCMIHRFDIRHDVGVSVPIGRPADNVQLYILDEQLNLLPEGQIGELYISGDGVARGYVNQAELTQQRFLSNPFMPNKRMYKTGDLARYRPDGKMEYTGRRDNQVKIKGYRIELGEIESALLGHEDIQEAVVAAVPDTNGSSMLRAYYIARSAIEDFEIRTYLLGKVPVHMIPAQFVPVEEIPLTPNGKVDFVKLSDIPLDSRHEESESNSSASKWETLVYQTVAKVLNIEGVGHHHNFYQMGGDSIKAIQISAKLFDIGIQANVKDILSFPVMKQLAAIVQLNHQSANQERAPLQGEVASTPITAWFLEQKWANRNYWNQSVLLEVDVHASAEAVERATQYVIAHHDSLRMNLNTGTGRLYYNEKHVSAPFRLERFDLSQLKEKSIELKSGMNIEDDLLFRAAYFSAVGQSPVVLFTAHHLVIDAVSWRIVLDDWLMFLQAVLQAKEPKMPRRTSSFQDWAKALHEGGDIFVQELAYWSELDHDAFVLPPDGQPDQKGVNKRTLTLSLDENETEFLLTKANLVCNTRTDELLLTALALAVNEETRSKEMVAELEGHGREELRDNLDVSRTVGWFTSMYPVRLRLDGERLVDHVKGIKEQLRAIPNKGIGYGVLKYVKRRLPAKENLKRIRFNYLGEMDNRFKNEAARMRFDDHGEEQDACNAMTSLLEINALVVGGRLTVWVAFDESDYRFDTIDRVSRRMMGHIQAILQFCAEAERIEYTTSDFDAAELSQAEIEALFE
ncbi:non-ribosomal peptide synthetase [Paenibacillus methanolicus]|uniref:Non-ribosomal peptide synthase protein (TIGR01720 family)/amino acid adenylation domain-containing protein n=1 Tax=Paenibacillus methanolicus TaxID=582686 RepID=A0A5S5CFG7_9BACL|nr:non-ribosomal peptide synthetase [Paenibacillus methanolicus]TYP76743.1 non-ribosomal peptide synthase protein (TIGR01720 family)/amino acid adenylation domain-containing protein [Paenibacillus methanolicus]